MFALYSHMCVWILEGRAFNVAIRFSEREYCMGKCDRFDYTRKREYKKQYCPVEYHNKTGPNEPSEFRVLICCCGVRSGVQPYGTVERLLARWITKHTHICITCKMHIAHTRSRGMTRVKSAFRCDWCGVRACIYFKLGL